MQFEKVKPIPGVPFLFEIERLGVKSPSNFTPEGYDFRYQGQLIEGRQKKPAITYLAPAAHSAIENAGAHVGDTIQLIKLQNGYNVTILGDAHEPAPPPRSNGYTDGGPRLVGNYQHGTSTQHPTRPAPVPPPPLPSPEAAVAQTSMSIHNGASQLGKLLGVYVRAAIDAKRIGEAYAREVGDDTRFESDDVRAMAITLFIEDARRSAGIEGKR